VTLKVPGKWLVISLFLVLETILVIFYNFHDDHDRATIAFAATVVGAAFALYSYLQGIEDRRTQKAHRFMERWTTPDMLEIRSVLIDVLEGRIDPVSLTRADTTKKEARLSVVSALNFFEEVSIAVLEGTANEDCLKDFFSAIVVQSFAKLEDWIKIERRIDNETTYYTKFELVTSRWRTK
jgi:hypothetical protein